MTDHTPAERLEYLRGQIHAEYISYGEIAELEGLAEHIEPGDVELLEWAGVPEFAATSEYTVTWTITLDAASEQDAAEKALEIQRDPESLALTFVVGGEEVDLYDERAR